MSHVVTFPRHWTTLTLARGTTARQELHNGQPATSTPIQAIEEAVLYLLSHPSRHTHPPGLYLNVTLATAAKTIPARIAMPVYADMLAIVAYTSQTVPYVTCDFTATSLRDPTGVTWQAVGGTSTSPTTSIALLEWAQGEGVVADPQTVGQQYEDIVVTAAISAVSTGTNILHALRFVPLPVVQPHSTGRYIIE